MTRSVAARALVAIAIGILCGVVSWLPTRTPHFGGHAFQVWWFAAHALIEQRDPYTTILFEGRPNYYYPPAAALVAFPFAWLPMNLAGSCFIVVSCAALAFVVTGTAWWPLVMFLSGSMFEAVDAAHLSPLLAIGFFARGGEWLGALKPNSGLEMLAYRPSWRAVALMLVPTVFTLLLIPSWPLEWIRNVQSSTYHFTPILAPSGSLLLLALARWRLPEARLLLAMALLPSTPSAYEVLALFAIARTWREMLILVVATWAFHVAMLDLRAVGDLDAYLDRARWVVVWLCYIPAMLLVLRRPNRGKAPAWLERLAIRLPPWLRGAPI